MIKKLWKTPLAILAVACTLLLSACGGPSVEELIRKDLDAQFSEVSTESEELMDSLQQSAGDSFEQLGIDPEEFMTAYLDGFSYEVGDITVDEKAGTADAAVTMKVKSLTNVMTDFATKYEEYIAGLDLSTVGSEEDLYAAAGEMLLETVSAAEVSEATAEFSYNKNDEGDWEIAGDAASAVMNAMM